MRLHRFYINKNIDKGKINSFDDTSLAHQLRQVFRLQTGSKAIFFNGDGLDHVCEIVSISKTEVSFKVTETKDVKRFTELNLVLAVSLIKKDNFEWIIQKGTELGVSEFIPLITDRSEKKGFNEERAQKIMIEAVEQSGRGDIPKISESKTLAHFLASEKRDIILFHTDGENFVRDNFKRTGDLVACIGPEGGWSEGEVSLFKEKGAMPIKVTAPVLRAETAAVSISSLLLLL